MIQNSKNTLLLSNFEAVTCERDVKVLKAVSQKNLGKLFERKGDQNVNSTFDFTKQDISAPFFSYETLGCGARPVLSATGSGSVKLVANCLLGMCAWIALLSNERA